MKLSRIIKSIKAESILWALAKEELELGRWLITILAFFRSSPHKQLFRSGYNVGSFTKTRLRTYVRTKDTTCSGTSNIAKFVADVATARGKATFKSINGATHSITSKAIDYEDLFNWFLG